MPITIGYVRETHEGLGGHLTLATVRLIGHQVFHDPRVLPLIVLGVGVFVIGSVLLARPFCRRRLTLLIGVPVAALAGIAVLGAIALLLVLLTLVGDLVLDSGGSQRRGPRDRERPKDTDDLMVVSTKGG